MRYGGKSRWNRIKDRVNYQVVKWESAVGLSDLQTYSNAIKHEIRVIVTHISTLFWGIQLTKML